MLSADLKLFQTKKAQKIVIGLLLALFVYVFINTAWVCDDAYITFRTIDNFINGYGLRWNVDERVQVYIHPLWMLIIALFYSVSNEIYFTTIAISFIFSILAIIILLSQTQNLAIKILLVCLLLSSKAFTDYTSSGLENPLSYILIAIFASLYSKNKYGFKNILVLCVLACLILLARLDLALIIIPPLLYSLYLCSKSTKFRHSAYSIVKALTIGFFPLIAWEILSLIYYGLLLPNTAYAKLCTGISAGELLVQGLYYIKISLLHDSITPLAIVAAIASSLIYFDRHKLFVAFGIILYIAWIIKIGGDFMAGRMLAIPFFLTAFLIVKINMKRAVAVLIIIMIALYNIGFENTPIKNTITYKCGFSWRDPKNKGIADERGVYYQTCGLLNVLRAGEPVIPYVNQGRQIRKYKKHYYICGCIGFAGYYAGPHTHIVDIMALADPLLSKLNCPQDPLWRIGHFRRNLPMGYIESIKSNSNLIADTKLKELYTAMRIITEGPLFSRERFLQILKFNTGCYNKYRDTDKYELDNEDHFFDLILYDTAFVYSDTPIRPIKYLPGDINGDGKVTGPDLIYLKQYFFGLNPQPPASVSIDSSFFFPAADVNGDCRITSADFVHLQNYLSGKIKILGHCPGIPIEK